MGHCLHVRIALVHYSVPPVVGGVETIIAEHARLFTAAGHEVTVLHGAGEVGECLPALADRTTPADQVAVAMRARLARQDVVFLHNVLTMPFHPGLTDAVWTLAEELGAVRMIAWVHDLAATNPDYPAAAELPRLRTAHPQIEYVAVSEHRRLEFAALTGALASVVPNGIDPVRALEIPEKWQRACKIMRVLERDIVLFQPTRLLRRKNVELSLRVVAALRALGKDALLLVTGAQDPHHAPARAYAEDLRELRNALGLQRDAVFLSDIFEVTDADLGCFYRLADALFFPSHREGFGLPLLEAALHRVPIFCPDAPPMNALLPEMVQLFDPALEPKDIATGIAKTLDQNPDTQVRKTVMRGYAWPVIFETHLAPLLRSQPTRRLNSTRSA